MKLLIILSAFLLALTSCTKVVTCPDPQPDPCPVYDPTPVPDPDPDPDPDPTPDPGDDGSSPTCYDAHTAIVSWMPAMG